MKNIFYTLLLIFVLSITGYAQVVEVITQVSMPFPTSFGEIEAEYDNFTATIINYTNTEQSIYLLPDLIGNNGVSLTTNRDFKPSAPIILTANETVLMTFGEIGELSGGLGFDDIDLEGVTALQLATNTLPEGSYQICVSIFDFDTEQQIGEGCSMTFPIGNANVPIIIEPFEGMPVFETETQNYVISWEPPSNDPMINMGLRYELKLVDLTDADVWDIEETFGDGGIPPMLELIVDGTQYIYNTFGSDPEMVVGHEYGVRIKAVDPDNMIGFSNDGFSEIRRFFYGMDSLVTDIDTTQTVEEEPEQLVELPDDCESRCDPVTYTDSTAITDLSMINDIRIGHFILEDHDLTSIGNVFNGTAKIKLDFLNNIKIDVQVSAIKINASGQVIDGRVKAKQDNLNSLTDLAPYINFPINNDLAQNAIGNIPPNGADTLMRILKYSRNILALAGVGSTGLPLGFSENIKGNEFQIGITDMILTPSSAKAKIVVGAKLAMFDGENSLVLVADSVCIHPVGFGGQYNVSLGANLVLPNDNENAFELSLNGNVAGNNEYCKINMGCGGLQSVDIAGVLSFPRKVLVPLNPDNTIAEEGKVKARFEFRLQNDPGNNNEEEEQEETENTVVNTDSIAQTTHHVNWVAEVTMDKFAIKKLDGWTFELETGYIDNSDLTNPPGILFPDSYHTTTDDFRGFYMKKAKITPPSSLTGDSTSYAFVHDLIIDPFIYGRIVAEKVLSLEKGRLDGWGFGIDSLDLVFFDNQLQEGYMKGVMQVPVLEETDTITYIAVISDMGEVYAEPEDDDDGYIYAFNVSLANDVNFPLFIANGTIYDDSYFDILFYPKGDMEPYARTVLHGDLTVDTEQFYPDNLPDLPTGVRLPEMEFKVDYTSGEGGGFNPDSTFIAFASPSKSIGGFQINMENFDVDMNTSGQEVSLDFDIELALGRKQLDIVAGTSFSLVSQLTVPNGMSASAVVNSIKTFKLQQIIFDSVNVEFDTEKFKFDGSLSFYNDPIDEDEDNRDKGIAGKLNVTLPIAEVHGKLSAQFGKHGTMPDIPEGDTMSYSANYYPYWYVDGLIALPNAIPLAGGFGIYGLGGGVGYNMVQTGAMVIQDSIVVGKATYEKHFGAFMIKMNSILGTIPVIDAFNADVSIEANFVDGGLDYIAFDGSGYVAASIPDRDEAFVTVDVAMGLQLANDSLPYYVLSGDLGVAINVADIIVGNMSPSDMTDQFVQGDFYASPETWYFYLGGPEYDYDDGVEPRGSAYADFSDELRVDVKTYLMVGEGVPTELPPLPPDIQRILDNPGGEIGETTPASNTASDIGSGKGIAHGVYVSVESSIDAKLIYAHLNAYVGYDMNLTKRTTNCANTGDVIGLNGWYAEGQAYAAFEGGLGIRFKMFGQRKDINLFNLAAAIALSAGGPNPFYFAGRASVYYELLGGKIKGNSSFRFSVGERCAPSGTDAFTGVKFIEYITPENDAEEVFVGKNISVKFALPMDKTIILPVPIYDGNDKLIKVEEERYTPYYELSLKRPNGQTVELQDISWNEDDNHEQLYVLPSATLLPQTNYRLKVTVKAHDHQTGNDLFNTDKNEVWHQDTIVDFTTGTLPPDLYDFVSYTVPLPYERFYLQGESTIGLVQFSQAIDQQFYFPQSIPGQKLNLEYYIRFTDLESQSEIEVPFTYSNKNGGPRLMFTMPTLENETIYALQVIRKGKPKAITMKGKGVGKGMKNINLYKSKGDLSTSLTLTNSVIAPGKTTQAGEDLLYHTYFRTSKFNTLRSKVNAITQTGTSYTGNTNNKKLKVELLLDEKFETRDFRDFHPNNSNLQNQVFLAKIKMLDQFKKPYHRNYADGMVGDFISQYVNEIKGGKYTRSIPADLNLEWDTGSTYANTQYWLPNGSFHASLADPLSEEEINNLWSNYLTTGLYSQTAHETSSNGLTQLNTTYLSLGNTASIIYDSHYKVQRDKIKLSNWLMDYYTDYFVNKNFELWFFLDHRDFYDKHLVMKNTDFKITNHTGNYNLKLYRNKSYKPGEYSANTQNMNINGTSVQLVNSGIDISFSTPSIKTLGSSSTLLGTTAAGDTGILNGSSGIDLSGVVNGGNTNGSVNTGGLGNSNTLSTFTLFNN